MSQYMIRMARHCTLETCLSCSFDTIKNLSNVVDHWVVDVKSINPFIYQEYTRALSSIKVPYIPGFNDDEVLDNGIEKIKQSLGLANVSKIKYRKL